MNLSEASPLRPRVELQRQTPATREQRGANCPQILILLQRVEWGRGGGQGARLIYRTPNLWGKEKEMERERKKGEGGGREREERKQSPLWFNAAQLQRHLAFLC